MMWPALFVNGLSAENRAELLTGIRHFLMWCYFINFQSYADAAARGEPIRFARQKDVHTTSTHSVISGQSAHHLSLPPVPWRCNPPVQGPGKFPHLWRESVQEPSHRYGQA